MEIHPAAWDAISQTVSTVVVKAKNRSEHHFYSVPNFADLTSQRAEGAIIPLNPRVRQWGKTPIAPNRAENAIPGPSNAIRSNSNLSGATLSHDLGDPDTLSTDEDEFWDDIIDNNDDDGLDLPRSVQGSRGAHPPSSVSSGPAQALPGPASRLCDDGTSQEDRKPPPAYQSVHIAPNEPLCPGSQFFSFHSADYIAPY